jgi:O-methyltransferase involved in polyketide biosynthesis
MAGYAQLWQGGLAGDAAEWLREHGWRPTVHALADLAAEYGRPLRRPSASCLLEAVRDG